MSDVAKKFVESWISDNVHPTTYEPEGDNKGAAHLNGSMLVGGRWGRHQPPFD